MWPNDSTDALSPHERRRSDRKKLIVDVKFEDGDATAIANTRDIGIGGLYMRTDAELEPGDEISVEMTFAGGEFNAAGVVAYTDPGEGVGVRFRNLSEKDETLLKQELETEEAGRS